MPTPTEWLNEFQVNTGPAGSGSQASPKIMGLASGGFVVAWTESADGLIGTDPGTDIVAKIFDVEGRVVREAFQLNQFSTSDDETDFDLAATHDGFVMTYLVNDLSSPDHSSVVFERFDGNGDPHPDAGSALTIASESAAGSALRNPQIIANLIDSEDSVFVTYEDAIGADTDVNARIIDENGVLGSQFAAAENGAGVTQLGDSAVLGKGNFVTVYEESDAGNTGLALSITNPLGDNVLLGGAIAANATNPSVASLGGNRFVVTYELNGDVFANIFSNAGVLERTVTVASGSAEQNQPVIAALKNGGFVVAWNDDTTGNVIARNFWANGGTEGSAFTIEDTNTSHLDISLTADGRLLFAWLGSDSEVFASIWDPRPNVIETSAPDVIRANFLQTDLFTSRPTDDTNIRAGEKGDTVLGQSARDVIISSGSGSFFGGGGNDTLYASANTFGGDFELLDGGSGRDRLYTTSFRGDYTVNLITGETDYAGAPAVPVESFINFEDIFTGVGSDTITGTDGDNLIVSGAGSDVIYAGAGNDTILAEWGNDTVFAGAGADHVNGGSGNDTIITSGKDFAAGESGDDTVIISSGLPSYIRGGEGVDTIDASASDFDFTIDLYDGYLESNLFIFDGFENLFTGSGDDVLSGTDVDNRIGGGAGDDQIFGRGGDDSLFGEDGDDILFGEDGNDTLEGGNGNDRLFGGKGNDEISGGEGDDVIVGKAGNDNLVGDGGNDIILGNFGNDFLTGGAGDDALYAGAGNDNLDGSEGNDQLYGGDGDDFVFGGTGDDLLVGSEGADTLVGSDGNDTLRGGNGDDFLTGLNDDDVLFGGDGDDLILGGDGNDRLWGGTGDDVLTGGARRDILHGGAGNDTFVFDDTSDSQQLSVDVIKDFEGAGSAVGDVIDLSGIDADITVAGNGDQSFTFLGVATREDGFAFGAGALWVSFFGGQTRVFALDDDDKTIDFVVWIEDGPSVSFNDYNASDFIL